MFPHLSAKFGRQASPANRARDRRRRPVLEALDRRELMSLGVELAGSINSTTRNAQFNPDNATNAGGETVIVWTDTYSSTDHDIRAQRYNASGGKLGAEIVVSSSTLDEDHASVAIDGSGRFEVAWVQTLPGGDTNVVARRFDANGNGLGSLITVAGDPTQREHDPDVATDLYGDFAVSYAHDVTGSNQDVAYKEYNSAGSLILFNNVANTSASESSPSIAMSQFGLVDVAWEQTYSSADHDIYLGRYGSGGQFLGRNVIAYTSAYDQTPSVSMDNAGDAAVAWVSNQNIAAVRVGSNGSQGAPITIAATPNYEYGPSVALRPGGGGFVVAYESLTSTSARAMVAEVSPSNVVTTLDAGRVSGGRVSLDAYGDYFLSYDGSVYDSPSSDLNIHGRRGYLRA